MHKRKKVMSGWRGSGTLVIGLVCAVGLLPLAAHAQSTAYNQDHAGCAVQNIRSRRLGAVRHCRAALQPEGRDAGLSQLQMYEAVLNLLPYIGYPRTLSTLGRFQRVYPDYISQRSQGQSPQPTEPWPEYAPSIWGERGMRVQEQLTGGSEETKQLIERLSQISPELAEWVRYDDFGRVFGRAGLLLIEREAIVLGALIAQGAPQIAFHYKALLRVGGDDSLVDTLLEAVSGIVDENALASAQQHIAEARE